MHYLIQFEGGETVESDELSFLEAMRMVTDNDTTAARREELANQLITQTAEVIQLFEEHGVGSMKTFDIPMDGDRAYLNMEKALYVHVVGWQKFIEDSLEYLGEKDF